MWELLCLCGTNVWRAYPAILYLGITTTKTNNYSGRRVVAVPVTNNKYAYRIFTKFGLDKRRASGGRRQHRKPGEGRLMRWKEIKISRGCRFPYLCLYLPPPPCYFLIVFWCSISMRWYRYPWGRTQTGAFLLFLAHSHSLDWRRWTWILVFGNCSRVPPSLLLLLLQTLS